MRQLQAAVDSIAVAFKNRDERHQKLEDDIIAILKDHKATILVMNNNLEKHIRVAKEQEIRIKELEDTLTDMILTEGLLEQN